MPNRVVMCMHIFGQVYNVYNNKYISLLSMCLRYYDLVNLIIQMYFFISMDRFVLEKLSDH